MRFLIFVFFLAVSCSIFAQKQVPSQKERISSFFEKEESIDWLGHFSGRMDDISDVDITLASAKNSIQGILKYTSSGETFRLKGRMENNRIFLTEWDVADRKSGEMHGTLNAKMLSLSWRNHDGSIGGEILAEEVGEEFLGISNCGNNKWINRYEATYRNESIQLLFNYTSKETIWGYLWIEAEKAQLLVKGKLSADGTLEAQMFESNSTTSKGTLSGTLESINKVDLKVNFSDGRKHFFSFGLKENMAVGCQSYTDYSSTYDIIYPKSKCSACNKHIEGMVDTWLEKCKNKVNSAKIEPNPDTRNAVRASCWSELSIWDDQYISGVLMFSTTWDADIQMEAFTFDVKRNKVLDLSDVFISKFNYQSWLDGYAKKESPKLALYKNEGFQKWITSAGFPILTLRKDGLALSTNFHPIYGRAEIVVPWEAAKPYLKRAAVRDLVQAEN